MLAGAAGIVKAGLYLPSGPGPYSAVVIMPSNGGVKTYREVYYADRLAEAGIAALAVDGYGSRWLAGSVYDQTVLTIRPGSVDIVADRHYNSGYAP